MNPQTLQLLVDVLGVLVKRNGGMLSITEAERKTYSKEVEDDPKFIRIDTHTDSGTFYVALVSHMEQPNDG